MKITAADLKELGVIDEIIPEAKNCRCTLWCNNRISGIF
jgi:acetyl-CoA carboxylase alpha subunit